MVAVAVAPGFKLPRLQVTMLPLRLQVPWLEALDGRKLSETSAHRRLETFAQRAHHVRLVRQEVNRRAKARRRLRQAREARERRQRQIHLQRGPGPCEARELQVVLRGQVLRANQRLEPERIRVDDHALGEELATVR
jgi:hypothetical protein